MDITENVSLKVALRKLEALYPEHKIFALSSLDDELREKLNELYQSFNYKDLGSFLKDIDYEIIPASAVKDIRSEVLYTPGSEPEVIRNKIGNMKKMLDEYYPSKIISAKFQEDHKSLYSTVSGLYQWLGYENASSFLEAYGYTYQPVIGRPSNDYQDLIEHLLEKYEDRPKPKNMGMLLFDNPELKGQIKTLQNKAPELFGMNLKAFFADLGLFAEKSETVSLNKSKSASGSMQEAAMNSLKELYDTLDPAVYGAFEEATKSLENLVIKQNKAGKIYVFAVASCLEEMKIPYGIESIAKGAFQNQKTLQKIEFPASLIEIDEAAFSGCTSLKEVLFAQGLKTIDAQAFYGCTSLERVTFPSSLEELGNKAFGQCTSLIEVSNVTPVLRVKPDTFEGCEYQYELFSDTESTPAEYFDWQPGKKDTAVISSYHGPDRIINIPSVIDGRMVASIGVSAFQGNETIEEVYMPDTVTVMQKDAFRECSNLKKIHLSDNLTKLVSTNFSGCTALKDVNIPNAVSEFKRTTFRDSPIEVLRIGKSLEKINMEGFGTYTSNPYTGEWSYKRTLKEVIIDQDNPYMAVKDGCIFSRDLKTLIGAIYNSHSYIVPEGVEVIDDFAFEHMQELYDVALPESLKSIGTSAFAETGLRSIRFGRNMQKIGSYAFVRCESLSSVIFEEGIEEIETGAFEGCPIVSCHLPSTLRVLGERSFSCFGGYDDKMADFVISKENPYLQADGNGLYILDENGKTFKTLFNKKYRGYTDDQYSYVLDEDTKYIADEAFVNCNCLKEVIMPEGLVSIGRKAFAQSGVRDFVLPSSLRQIGENAFPEKVEYWMGSQAGIHSIVVKEGNQVFFVDEDMLIENIENNKKAIVCFFGTKDVLTLPDNTVKIYGNAFANGSVEEICIPASVKEIGIAAFKGCGFLKRIRLGVKDAYGDTQNAIIYLPQTESEEYYWGPSIRDQYLDCIRSGANGSIFDFKKYDSLFLSISNEEDKILVAVDRLKSDVGLDPVYADSYRRCLLERPDFSVRTVISQDDASGLELLSKIGYIIQKERIDSYISLANREGKRDAQIFLMNYKNEKVGFDDSEFEL